MNQNTIEGNMKQVFGKVKEQWGKLTDDELAQTEGKSDKIEGLIQTKYGETEENVNQKLKDMGINS